MAAVDANEFTMVNQIHVNRNSVALKLKIIRVWRLPDRRNPNDVYSIEMILCDENVKVNNTFFLYPIIFKFHNFFFNCDAFNFNVYQLSYFFYNQQGDRIQANVFKRLFFKFERFLIENSSLIIRNPGVGVNSSKYKYAPNPNKLCLNMNTQVSEYHGFQGPDFGFSFVPFQRILDREVDEYVTIGIFLF
jgi:hypothetical protein